MAKQTTLQAIIPGNTDHNLKKLGFKYDSERGMWLMRVAISDVMKVVKTLPIGVKDLNTGEMLKGGAMA